MTKDIHRSVCPHDCPSACAVEVERLGPDRIGRLRGAAAMPYTDGVICAKVARYAERTHHPDRILHPLLRTGPKGSGQFTRISWDEALDRLVQAFADAARRHGPETVWPYYYAGTMGLVQFGSIKKLRAAMGWSIMDETICSSISAAGWMAGVGQRRGVDPREMAQSDLIVVWGGNPVATQVQVMNWVAKARRERGARLVVIDPYRTGTAEKADLHLAPRPGTDGALACAVMHVLFKEGFADRDYMKRHTDAPEALEAHLAGRTPAWAAAITGLDEAEITAFARLYGRHKRSYLRIGYGFTRSRNGAANMHAVSCLPAVTGAWAHPGGGALASYSGLFRLAYSEINGKFKPGRSLDMSRLGAVLTGAEGDLKGGPPVTAMLVQNSNPAAVAPDSLRVRQGLAREDLFLCVHEQMMTETALMADIVLPATTFVEHEDLYFSYGHSFLQIAKRVIDPLGEARSNYDLVAALARRFGVAGFERSAWEVADATLRASNLPGAEELWAMGWLDCARPFDEAHFLTGFPKPGGRFRFVADWPPQGRAAGMPSLPDHWAVTDEADGEHPFRLVTAPARHFLNSSFSETPTSRRLSARPTALVHPEDCRALGLGEGQLVRLGNRQGAVVLHLRPFDGVRRGVVVVEGIWPNRDFGEGVGINALTSAAAVAPAGGAAFHDTAVWLRPA